MIISEPQKDPTTRNQVLLLRGRKGIRNQGQSVQDRILSNPQSLSRGVGEFISFYALISLSSFMRSLSFFFRYRIGCIPYLCSLSVVWAVLVSVGFGSGAHSAVVSMKGVKASAAVVRFYPGGRSSSSFSQRKKRWNEWKKGAKNIASKALD